MNKKERPQPQMQLMRSQLDRPLQQHGSHLFTVGHLLDKRVRRGQVQYLVRWDGYESDEDTWGPSTSLPDNKIEEFEQTSESGFLCIVLTCAACMQVRN